MHPVQRNLKTGVNLPRSSRSEELTVDVVKVGFLVVRNISYVLIELAEVWRKDTWREQFFGLDVVLVVHHFLKPFLISLVPPWKLSNSKVTEQVH